jgi:guanylate kinase
MKKLIIVGKAASGKNYVVNKLLKEDKHFSFGVSYTTRPPRDNEVSGKDYFFISKLEFKVMSLLGMFREKVKFNGWYYGMTKSMWKKSNIIILNPSGVRSLSDKDRLNSLVVYIHADVNTRRKRMERRNDADSIERRIQADEKDFRTFEDYDIVAYSSDINYIYDSYMQFLRYHIPQ